MPALRSIGRIRSIAAVAMILAMPPVFAGAPSKAPVWVEPLGGPKLATPDKTQAIRSFATPKQVNYRQPARQYLATNLLGWTLHLEDELARDHPGLAAEAANRLAVNASEILKRLPVHTAPVLRRLPFFLLLGEEAKAGGRNNGAEYFQRHAPDHWPLVDPRWRSALVIYSARNYVWLDDGWATRVLMHELAHAWQLEQWPEKQPQILAAWENARRQGYYRNRWALDGSILKEGYARVNQLEYFAELSCAYFWRGEYEPFDRASLWNYDPEGFAMIEKIWGNPKAASAASAP